MNPNNSNDLAQDIPTLRYPLSNTLAHEAIGNLIIEMVKLPNNDLLFEVTCEGELLRISRLRDISEFQAGRVFEKEVAEYRKILHG